MPVPALGRFPTRVMRFPSEEAALAGLWIKRDDACSDLYGGNKVRKLGHLFAAARDRGRRRIVTVGAAGSHQVIATALYGQREGFEVEAVLVAQPASDHAKTNLRVALAHGLRPVVAASWSTAPVVLGSLVGRDAYLVPLGGSNPVGTLGFVDAARELAAQVRAGDMPEPDVIVTATGSGGTVAGLAVGLEGLGLKTRVLGVAVMQPVALLQAMARRLVKQTAARIGMSRSGAMRAIERIEVDGAWVGRGYGYATREGEAAMAVASRAGLALDATYTGKAFARALVEARQDDDRVILFWNTLSSATLPPADAPLPEKLDRLFT